MSSQDAAGVISTDAATNGFGALPLNRAYEEFTCRGHRFAR
ncbi:hypothetical protein [Phycicoccus flavus]|nr:hypothetical protein [Phycicoccus flavus]